MRWASVLSTAATRSSVWPCTFSWGEASYPRRNTSSLRPRLFPIGGIVGAPFGAVFGGVFVCGTIPPLDTPRGTRQHSRFHMTQRFRVLSTVALLVLSGCRTHTVIARATIPHPSGADLIPSATQIAVGPLGPLRESMDRVAITQIDEANVCIQIALSSHPRDRSRTHLGSYRFEIVATDDQITQSRERSRYSPVGEWQLLTSDGKPA